MFSNRRLQNSSECKHQPLFNENLTSYEEFHVVIFNGGTWVSLHDVDRLWSGLCSWYYWWWFLLGPRLDNCGLLPPRLGDGVTARPWELSFSSPCSSAWAAVVCGSDFSNITSPCLDLSEIINIWKKYITKQNTYVAKNIVHLPFKESICHHLHLPQARHFQVLVWNIW